MLDLTSTNKEADLESCAINDYPCWRCWKIMKIAPRRSQLWHFYHLDLINKFNCFDNCLIVHLRAISKIKLIQNIHVSTNLTCDKAATICRQWNSQCRQASLFLPACSYCRWMSIVTLRLSQNLQLLTQPNTVHCGKVYLKSTVQVILKYYEGLVSGVYLSRNQRPLFCVHPSDVQTINLRSSWVLWNGFGLFWWRM